MRRSGFILSLLILCCCIDVPDASSASRASDENDSGVVYGKALDYYELAEEGNAEAQYQMANCYRNGYGVVQSDSLAFVWAKRSAAQNYPAGLYFLAYCYETGSGCTRNAENAKYLYHKAYKKALQPAKSGDASAQFVLGKIFDYGNGDVKQNQNTAVIWYRRAADQGYTGAQFNLGNCFQLGEGVKQDKGRAVYWYREAALQDDADAQYMLALCYASGDGVNKSNRKAIDWFKRSSRLGNRLAQQILLSIGETW